MKTTISVQDSSIFHKFQCQRHWLRNVFNAIFLQEQSFFTLFHFVMILLLYIPFTFAIPLNLIFACLFIYLLFVLFLFLYFIFFLWFNYLLFTFITRQREQKQTLNFKEEKTFRKKIVKWNWINGQEKVFFCFCIKFFISRLIQFQISEWKVQFSSRSFCQWRMFDMTTFYSNLR